MGNLLPVGTLLAVTQSKEALLGQADASRDIARRARRLAKTLPLESDQRRLSIHAQELDELANRLETEAAGAKTLVVRPAEGLT